MIRIRAYRDGDAGPLFAVFYRAVHAGTQAFYSEDERNAWAPSAKPGSMWVPRLAEQLTLVAEQDDGTAVGFMTMGDEGYLDYAYVAPEVMGTGVANALHASLLEHARHRGLTRLETEASHLARRFFLKHGWRDEGEQQVERLGVAITNFRMSLDLA